jgi:hypothetical protein
VAGSAAAVVQTSLDARLRPTMHVSSCQSEPACSKRHLPKQTLQDSTAALLRRQHLHARANRATKKTRLAFIVAVLCCEVETCTVTAGSHAVRQGGRLLLEVSDGGSCSGNPTQASTAVSLKRTQCSAQGNVGAQQLDSTSHSQCLHFAYLQRVLIDTDKQARTIRCRR